MNKTITDTLAVLDNHKIAYEVDTHPAAFTIEELKELGLDQKGEIPKNLFLRDDKSKNFFLVILQNDKDADLKALRNLLGTSRLGFASDRRLDQFLKVKAGSVSILNLLNDEENIVNLVIDKDLLELNKIGVHPNDNTATVWASPQDLISLIEEKENKMLFVDL